MSNLPQIAQLEYDTVTEGTSQAPRGKSFKFDFQTGQFVLENGKMVEAKGIDALKIWIQKILRTTRDRFMVYEGTDYGTSIDKLIGSNHPFSFIQDEVKRQTIEALLQHEEINGITDLELVRDGSRMTINFSVDSVYGINPQEVRF